MNEPPTYLIRAVGAVPDDPAGIDQWIEAASIIERYRLEHGITDKRRALGHVPREPSDAQAWQQAWWNVETIIESPHVGQEYLPSLEPGGPGLDL